MWAGREDWTQINGFSLEIGIQISQFSMERILWGWGWSNFSLVFSVVNCAVRILFPFYYPSALDIFSRPLSVCRRLPTASYLYFCAWRLCSSGTKDKGLRNQHVPTPTPGPSFKSLFIYLLAVLGLHCCAGFSVGMVSGGHFLVAMCRLALEVASFVVEHGF